MILLTTNPVLQTTNYTVADDSEGYSKTSMFHDAKSVIIHRSLVFFLNYYFCFFILYLKIVIKLLSSPYD